MHYCMAGLVIISVCGAGYNDQVYHIRLRVRLGKRDRPTTLLLNNPPKKIATDHRFRRFRHFGFGGGFESLIRNRGGRS